MKILVLPRYGRLGASSRLRMMQYFPKLQQAGFDLVVRPMLGDDYVRDLYKKKVSVSRVARSYVQRFCSVLSIRKYDVVWLEKEMFPWLPAWLDPTLLPRNTRLVVDYDDAVFHRYDSHRSVLVRTLLGRKIDVVMRRADLVLAGNEYLAERARAAGCGWVEILPTVIDLDRYQNSDVSHSPALLSVGWMGSPSTAPYLEVMASVAATLQRDQAVRFVAIGAKPDQLTGTPFEVEAWSEESEVGRLQSFDVGIMPLPDEPFERGKCGYKLIQYMACGLPVVASPVGVNRQIVEHGVNGFLAETPEEWSQALRVLLNDADLRKRMGQAGRAKVEREYCIQATAPRLISLLRDVASKDNTR